MPALESQQSQEHRMGDKATAYQSQRDGDKELPLSIKSHQRKKQAHRVEGQCALQYPTHEHPPIRANSITFPKPRRPLAP